MKTLEVLLKHTKLKLIVMSLAFLVPIILFASFSAVIEQHAKVSFEVFKYLTLIFVEAGIGYKIVRYVLVLVKPNFAEYELTKINDERNTFIRMKALNLCFKIVLFINAIAAIVIAFINEVSFYVIVIEILIMLICYFLTLIYFSKKY